MHVDLTRYKAVSNALDAVSPSFCMAKWLQVTMHLQNGKNHSCHHPPSHHTPLSELENDPMSLHNTLYKQKQQQMMLDGKRPDECQYCWNVEDLSGDLISDRVLKSADKTIGGGEERISGFVDELAQGAVSPENVEVSFSNVCNFKCSYCSPVHSSKWVSEISNHGSYQLSNGPYQDLSWLESTNQLPIHHTKHNPYVEAFWKWWPELVPKLKVFRITGGEPLMDPNTFKVIEYFKENKFEKLEFSINSNLGVPRKQIQQYIDGVSEVINVGNIKNHVIYTSVDAHGAQAEYGRHGLNYEYWLENVNLVLDSIPNLKLVVMCTANIFSVTSFDKLMKDILELKLKYAEDSITIDVSTLRWPHHQNLTILPAKYVSNLEDTLDFMIKHQRFDGVNHPEYGAQMKTSPYKGFSIPEVTKGKRLIEFAKNPPNDNEGISVNSAMRDFYLFVNEHDNRRGTNFLETFPELTEFYEQCRTLNTNIIATG